MSEDLRAGKDIELGQVNFIDKKPCVVVNTNRLSKDLSQYLKQPASIAVDPITKNVTPEVASFNSEPVKPEIIQRPVEVPKPNTDFTFEKNTFFNGDYKGSIDNVGADTVAPEIKTFSPAPVEPMIVENSYNEPKIISLEPEFEKNINEKEQEPVTPAYTPDYSFLKGSEPLKETPVAEVEPELTDEIDEEIKEEVTEPEVNFEVLSQKVKEISEYIDKLKEENFQLKNENVELKQMLRSNNAAVSSLSNETTAYYDSPGISVGM
ncbi:MAG: hypothetical protein RSG95_03640 [Bacilli bacterium]